MLLPLEVLPHGIERVAKLLPFMAMSYAPARLASGHFEPALLLVQLGWLVVLSAVAVAVFAAGERRLQVVGG
jgi:ABC-2 type transport system permease protein